MSEITLKFNTEKAIEDLEVIKSKIKEVAELAEKKEVHLDLNLEVNFEKENAELKRELEGRQNQKYPL